MLLKNRGRRGYKGLGGRVICGNTITCPYEATPKVASTVRFKTKERIISFLELFSKQYGHLKSILKQ